MFPFIIPIPPWVVRGSRLVGEAAKMGEAVGVVASQGEECKWSADQIFLSSLLFHFSSSSSPTYQANRQALVQAELFLIGWFLGHLWKGDKRWTVRNGINKILYS